MLSSGPRRTSITVQGFRKRGLLLLILLLCISLIRGLSYSVVIPPWQAPDEPGHLEYASLLSEEGWPLTTKDISFSLQREMLRSMQEHQFWKYVGRPEPERIPDSFSDDPLLVRSGTQVGDEAPLYYLFPALIFALSGVEDLLLQLRIMRWFSVILSSGTVAISYLIADELFSQDRFMVVAIPIFIAFLPMFTFIGASANNDSLAILVTSLLIWQLVRALRRGLSWHSGLVICVLTLLSVAAKKTAVFTIPLVMIAVLIHLRGRPVALRDSCRFIGGASCMLALLFLSVVTAWGSGDAADWVEQPEPWMDTQSGSVARSGGYSLHVVDDTPHIYRRLVQSLPYNLVRELRGNTVILNAWCRSANGEQRGRLLVVDSEERNTQVFSATETWQNQSLIHTVSPQAKSIRVVLRPSASGREGVGDLYFDDVVLVERGGEGLNLLHNGSGEVSRLRIWPHLERLARHVPLREFLNAQSYDPASLQRYVLYVLLTFASFWANFGWLTMPLHMFWYEMLALLSFVALIGLGIGGMKAMITWRRGDSKPLLWQRKALVLLIMATCLIISQTFLPMIGRDWQPQGRYLFPAIIPIATLFSLGWREVVPRQWHKLLVVGWILAFFLFDSLCFFGYVRPYFYG